MSKCVAARALCAVLGAGSLIGVFAWSDGASATGAPAVPDETAAPSDAAAKKFTLIYNVNNSGYIDVCGCKHKEVRQGSLTRRASFLRQIRATGREILLLDGGSSLYKVGDRVKDAERAEAIRKAAVIVEAYNRMGYRAMAVGPFELAGGLDALRDLEKKAKFELLSANLVDAKTGELLFEPHIVETVGGVRVGVIGLTLESMSKVFLGKVAPGTRVESPKDALAKSLAELKGKVDLIVALSHLREEVNRELADAFPEVQILIDPYIQYGNPHTWIKKDEWLSTRKDTVFLRGDGQGARLGCLDIEMTRSGKPLVHWADLADLEDLVKTPNATEADRAKLAELRERNEFDFQITSIEPHHLTDPEIDQLVEAWKNNVDLASVKAGEAELPHRADYLTAAKCQGCHEKQYEWWKGTKHAVAMASLERENNHRRFDCIGCHTLGYGKAFLDVTNAGVYANVQCESCHGTNPQHVDDPKQHRFGRITRKDCLVCHNKEQTLKDFHFARARRMVACPKG